MTKLSIIIPVHNRKKNLDDLLKELSPQKTEEVEIIIVDDGSDIPYITDYDVKLIRLIECSGGASVPRNVGLKYAKGEYITFIDSDDMVSNDYIQTILDKTKEDWDYCYISWKGKTNTVIIKDEPPKWNCCVWNCVYKRSLIGNERFKPELKMAEDYDFNKRVKKGKKANITKILYYYNEDTPNSLTKQGQIYNEKYKGE
jgi:glycosyltransferase involved in cell wall biosynthesis